MTEISKFTQLLIYLEGMQSSATNRLEYLDELMMAAQKEITRLRGRDVFLSALEQAGVDNWSGYSFAHEILREG